MSAEIEVKLPCGFSFDGKTVERRAVIREITGSTQRALGTPEVQRRYTVMLRTILQNCLVRIGDKDASAAMLDSLDVADRDYLFFEIRRVSLGSDLHYEMSCPECHEKIRGELNIDDLDCLELLDPADPKCRYQLRSAGEMLHPYRKVWTARHEKLGVTIEMQFDICRLQEKRADVKNPAEMSQRVLADNLWRYQDSTGEVKGPQAVSFFDDKPQAVISWMAEQFDARTPGVAFPETIKCHTCVEVVPFRLENADFFARPKVQTDSGLIRTKRTG